MDTANKLRQLPSVNDLLQSPPALDLAAREGHARTVAALRTAVDAARDKIKQGSAAPTADELLAHAQHALQLPFSLINATGVIVHTNLGRATLSPTAQEAMLAVAQDYSPLEFDMASGERGMRGEPVRQLLCNLTGAQDALVVNNCAAATVLMLGALAYGKGVVISRGQLVEIGGGFRVPDILRQSGARLVEVGTTNRVRLDDYQNAIHESTNAVGAVLRVHSSNFKMIGFVQEVGIDELAKLGQPSVVVLDDLGSGALIDTSQFGLSREPMPQDSVKAGVDVTCFSGDKLLGGPQAGILVGKREAIERCRRHPLARAFRADKFTLAALGATLLHYAREEAVREIPVIRMMAMRRNDVLARAEYVKTKISNWLLANQCHAEIIDGASTVGGGSLPGETLPTALLALACSSPEKLLVQLRTKGVIARIKDNRVLLDMRTVLDDAKLIARLGVTD